MKSDGGSTNYSKLQTGHASLIKSPAPIPAPRGSSTLLTSHPQHPPCSKNVATNSAHILHYAELADMNDDPSYENTEIVSGRTELSNYILYVLCYSFLTLDQTVFH